MKQARCEMIQALRRTLDHSEETEQVIDWIQDAWDTYDFLSRLIGRSYACRIMEAVDEENAFIELQESVAHEHTSDYINGCMLN
jgi:hypothetical protein